MLMERVCVWLAFHVALSSTFHFLLIILFLSLFSTPLLLLTVFYSFTHTRCVFCFSPFLPSFFFSFYRSRKQPTFISAFQTSSILLTSWSALNGSTLITQLIWPIGLSPSRLPDVSTLLKLKLVVVVVDIDGSFLCAAFYWSSPPPSSAAAAGLPVHCALFYAEMFFITQFAYAFFFVLFFISFFSLALRLLLFLSETRAFRVSVYLPCSKHKHARTHKQQPFSMRKCFCQLAREKSCCHLIEFDELGWKRRQGRRRKGEISD